MKKKIFGLFVFLVVVILLFLQFYVKNFFKITDIQVVKTMGDATAFVSKFSSREIHTNTTFKNVNDEAIYKVTIKNNTNKDYKIKKILTNNSSSNIKYETNIINKSIKAKKKASFYLKVIYLKETNFIESKINEPSKITILYNGGVKTNLAVNSHTNIYILLISIAFILSILNIYILFRKEKNYKEIYYIPIIFLVIFIVLLSNALSCIEIRNKITLFNDKLKSFRISFISDGKETSSDSIKYGKKIIKPTAYNKNGYMFKYWSLEDDGEEFDFNTLVNKDIKLYANYDIINYNITYDLDGGTLEKENPSTYTINDTFTLNNPSKNGFIFDGWIIDNKGDTPIMNLVIPTNTTGDLNIKAVYIPIDYNISYNLNGGDYTKNNPSTYNASKSYKISDAKKKGYIFTGWTGTNLNKPTVNLEIKKGTYGDLEFSANYELSNYSISYTGLTDAEIKALGNPTSYNINSDDIYLKSPKYRYDEDNDPIDKFIGFEYKGKIYTNPVIYKGSVNNRIYEAKWERLPDINYTIVYDLDGGSLPDKLKNKTSFTKFDQTFKLFNPIKLGYTFIGWTGSNGDTPKKEVNVKSGTKKNLTFKANYTKDVYNLSYNLKGGVLDSANKTTYSVDDTFTLNNPNKKGFNFTGWSLDGSNDTPKLITTIGPNDVGDKSLVANYDLVNYDIKYNLDGGRFTNLVNNTYDINTIIELEKPVKRGYTFVGWTGSNGNTPSTSVRFGPGETGVKEYSANYKVNTYNIKYNLDGGTALNPSNYTILDNDITLNNPIKDGYTFTGWTAKDSSNQEVNVTIKKGSIGNLEYTAHYVINNYDIKYNLDGGVNNVDNKNTYTINDSINIKEPTKRGYTFIGWTTNDNNVPLKNISFGPGETGVKEYSANYDVNTYNIKYNLDGGTALNPNSYTIEDNDITLNKPIKDGYTFTGWTTKDSSNQEINVTIKKGSIGNLEYTAHYVINNYDIKYNLDGGSLNNQVNTYTINDTIELNNPSKIGYEFTGWTGSNGNTPSTSVKFGPGETGIKEYSANYTPINYSITYDLDGGTLVSSNPNSYTIEDNITLNNPIKDGYTFVGWIRFDGDNPEIETKILKGSYGNKTYKAVYTINSYNITYDLDGGTLVNSNPNSYTILDDITLNNPNKDGYTFVGWSLDNCNTYNENYKIIKGTFGNKEFKACYNPIKYTISYEGLYDEEINAINNPSTYTIEDNDITLVNPPDRVDSDGDKTDIFVGWSYDGSTSLIRTIPKGSIGNRVYTAVYNIASDNIYTIKYNLDGGTLSSSNKTRYTKKDETFTLNNPSKKGYNFIGWTGSNGDTPSIDVKVNKGTRQNLEFTANYKIINYSVYYDLDGGTALNPNSYTVNDTFTLNNPTKKGYTFRGWTGSNSFTPEEVVTINKGSTVDMAFRANYTIDVYSIKYNLNGGYIETINPTIYNVNSSIELSNPKKNGYTFVGWTGTNLDNPSLSVKFGPGETCIKEYSANYEVNTYSITYDLDGGTLASSNPDSYTVETSSFTLNNPSKEGYTFVGWTTGSGDTPLKDVSIKTGTTGNKAYKANFIPTKYLIMYNLNGGVNSKDNKNEYSILDTISLKDATKDGYTFIGWTTKDNNVPLKNISFGPGETGIKEFTANYEPISYSITYDLDGGSLDKENPSTYTIESDDITLNNPSKEGYTFVGWSTSNSNSLDTNVLIPTGSIGNKTFKANYELYSYTISYDLDGGINDDRNVNNYNNGDTITIYEPTKRGYNFIGWTTKDNNVPLKNISFGPGETGKKEFKANYEPITYSIMYDLDGGSLDKENPSTYTVEDEINLNSPIKDGYTFVGWEVENSNTSSLVTKISKGNIGNKKYKAKYEIINYSITYDLDGGVNNIDNKNTYTINDSISIKEPTKRGYTFIGWTTKDNNVPLKNISFGPGETGIKEFKANYEIITYHITYRGLDNNTLTILNNKTEYTVLDDDITINNPWDITDLDGDLTERFAGWDYQDSTYFTYTIPAGSIGDRDLRATYVGVDAPTYSITYDLDGGILPNDKENKISFNKKTDSFKLNNPSKKGYTFIGWTGSNGDTPSLNITIKKGTRENLHFKANYELDKYSIEYILSDGELSDNNPVEYDIYTDTFTLNNPSKRGYTFIGWTGSNGVNPELNITIDKGSTGNRYYSANYTKNTYNITYDLDGGSLEIDNPTSYNIDSTVTLNPPTKRGYTFIGYKENDSDEIKYNVVFGPGEIGDKTFTAVYEPTRYTLRYNLNNGYLDIDNKDSYTIEDDFTLNNPTKTGYTFTGWTGTDLVNNELSVNIKNQIGDRAFIANYEPISYSITYDLDGGFALNPSSYSIESDTFTLNNPTKRGYTFIGWTGSNGEVPTTNLVINKGSIDNKTYKANYVLDIYNITYNLDGGNLDISNKNTYSVEDDFILNNPTKVGYEFIGWTGTGLADKVTNLNIKNMVGDKVYDANYLPITYSITYDLDGGTALNPNSYTVEDNDITLNEPTKRGYTFTGWTYSDNVTPNKNVLIEHGSYGNKEFKANYVKNTYSITYDLDGGSLNELNPSTYDVDSTFTLNNPSKIGYDFEGWTGSNGNVPNKNITISNEISDKSYKAVFKPKVYNITYTGLTEAEIIYLNNPSNYNIESNTITLNNPPDRTDLDGDVTYIFSGWRENSTTTTSMVIPSGSSGNKTYEATWTKAADIIYSITYNYNGGTLDDNVSNITAFTKKYDTFTLNNPSKEGYNFIGWTGSNGNTPNMEVSVNKGTRQNLEFTANYEVINYNINLDLGGGISNNNSTYNIENSYTLANPTKTGYTFTGWTGANGVNPQTNVTIPKGSTGDKSYTANYVATPYNISYNLGSGTLSTSNPTTYYITSSNITLNNPTKTGYTFTGWTGSNGNTPSTSVTIPSGSTGDRNYTANYSLDNYSITYNLNGGVADNPTTYNVTSNTITLNNPSKEGYTFIGWTGSNGNTPQTSVSIQAGSYGNKSYTANFAPINYSISYSLNGGSVSSSNPSSYNATSNTITLNNPTKTGYTFTGWTGANGNTPQISVTIPSGSTGNKSYTANYSLNTYTISYTLNGGTTASTNPNSYNVNSSTITLSNPSKTGYTFTGWTGSNGTTASTTVKITSGSTGNKSYTANYSANKYTITYNSNNGYSSTKTQNLTYGSSYTIQSNSFTRSGYKFIKWNTKSDGSGTSYYSGKSVSNLTSTSGGNINLYAIWERMNLTNSTLAEMADSEEFSDVVRDNSYDSNPRFIGGNPNNYVWYNGERWRIIGRFYTSGYTYKIMNTNCLRKDFNSTASNSWSSSDLKHDLDYTYWNSISSTYKGYIQNTKWYLGSTELSIPAKNMYSNERSGSTWTGDVALIYPSDYIFATSASGSTTRVSCWTMGGSNWNNSVAKSYGCANNDWIWKNNHTKFNWMITPNSADKAYVHGFFEDGKAGSTPANVLYGSSTSEKNIACPALYLKSSVKFTSGTGTYSNPYSIST